VVVSNGRSVYVDGSSAVAFSIDGDRQDISNLLVQHFARAGWRQRKTQLLNPSQATSFDGGWEHLCGCVLQHDAVGHLLPPDPYFKWRGEWEDTSGNMVSYELGGQGDRLYGYAGYLPHEVVVEVRRKLGR
jgi:hypothetical protein